MAAELLSLGAAPDAAEKILILTFQNGIDFHGYHCISRLALRLLAYSLLSLKNVSYVSKLRIQNLCVKCIVYVAM